MLTINLDDLQTLERAAYQAGSYAIAELCAKAIDAEAEREQYEKETETAVSDAEKERDEVSEQLTDFGRFVSVKLDELERVVTAAKRVGCRKEIDDIIAEIREVLP